MAINSKFAALALATDQSARMNIVHPVTGQPLRNKDGAEAYLDLLASSSPVGRAFDREVTDRMLRSRGARYTAEQADMDAIEKLSKLTVGWHLVTLDGDTIDEPFSAGSARDLYGMPELGWLRSQAEQFVSDLGNYRPGSSKS